MKIHHLAQRPDQALAAALARFEASFTYPLGEGATFSISHGEDYARFFRAMGECQVAVAERDGEVLGTLGGAVRDLGRPDGGTLPVLYIGDLKVRPGIEAGIVLLRLAAALGTWARPRVCAAFGVAMDGTRKTPERYTGRYGIPAFAEIGKIMVLRLPGEAADAAGPPLAAPADAFATYRSLARRGYLVPAGTPAERSAIEPVWLRLPSGAACGMLEDTRKAKRLFATGAAEMVSGHLSHFAFADPRAGADLLRRAAGLAAAKGLPALFCAVPSCDAQPLVDALGSPAPTLAPATLYGAGLGKGDYWYINTSEI